MRERDPDLLTTGRLDPSTGAVLQTGLRVLVAGLRQRYGDRSIETSTKAINELVISSREYESIDEAWSRHGTIRSQ